MTSLNTKLYWDCKKCGTKDLLITEMTFAGYRVSICKKCRNEWRKERRKDPEVLAKHKACSRNFEYKKKYGITQEEYDKLVEFQQGGCAICRKACQIHERLSVDHDHETNVVRGLLCQKCNTAIGLLYEDEDLFWNALEYLKKHKWSKSA